MYALINEDLTNIGGPMWMQETPERWRKYFHNIDRAKTYAEKDYGEPIDWMEDVDCGRVVSPDLGHTMCTIVLIRTEDREQASDACSR